MGTGVSRKMELDPDPRPTPSPYFLPPLEKWATQAGPTSVGDGSSVRETTKIVYVEGYRNPDVLVTKYAEMHAMVRDAFQSRDVLPLGKEVRTKGVALFSTVPSESVEVMTRTVLHVTQVKSDVCVAIVSPVGLENSRRNVLDYGALSAKGGTVIQGIGHIWRNGVKVSGQPPCPIFGEYNTISLQLDFLQRQCGIVVCDGHVERVVVMEIPPQGRLALIVPAPTCFPAPFPVGINDPPSPIRMDDEGDTIPETPLSPSHSYGENPVLCPRRDHAACVRANRNAIQYALRNELLGVHHVEWPRVASLLRHPDLHPNVYLKDIPTGTAAPLLYWAVGRGHVDVVRGLLQSPLILPNAAAQCGCMRVTPLYLAMKLLWTTSRADDLMEIAGMLIEDTRCDVTVGLWCEEDGGDDGGGGERVVTYPIQYPKESKIPVVSPVEKCPTYCNVLIQKLIKRLESAT